MRVIRVILTVIGLGLAAGGVYFVIETPPGTDGIVKYIPAGMMFFFSALMFMVWLPMISRLDHGSLLRSGTPATATIVAIDDSGSTVNEQPVFRFTLDVHRADGTTRRATTHQIVSRAALGSLQTGLVVAVRVDENDPSRVAIDPSGNVETAASTGVPPTGGTLMASDVVRDGVGGNAVVQSVSLTGDTFGALSPDRADASTADDPMVVLTLQVSGNDTGTFTSQGIHRVPDGMIGRLTAGSTIPVAYLPRDPANTTAVDWVRLGAQAPES